MSDVRGPLLRYSAARLGIFAAALTVAAVLGFRGFPLLLVAVVVSSVVSLLGLRRQRDAVAAAMEERRLQAKAREAVEDERMQRAKAEYERRRRGSAAPPD